MLISCEKCETTYVLDDALIPPQGAPVQCTKCGHVFTARLAPAEPPPAPPPRAASNNSTLMFGGTPEAAASKNQTMMFGGGGPKAPAAPAPPPAPKPPPSARTTMMFGGGSASAPPPAASSKATMVFGAGAAAAPPPAAPAPSSKATMVFGASPVAAPAAPKNQTMVFGAGAPAAAPRSAPPPPASAKQTMVFGAAPPPAAAATPASKQTMVFGAAPPPAVAATPASKQTMVFGATAAAPAPALEAEPPAEETILEQPGQSARTAIFGNPSPPAAPPAKNQTMMFGRPAAIPKVTAGVVELAGMSADEEQPNESTVRVDVQQVIEEHGDDRAAGPAEEPPRHDRTQRYAMSEGDPLVTPPEGEAPVKPRHDRTQLFAMSSSQPAEPTVPQGAPLVIGDSTLPPESRVPVLGPRSGSTDVNSTLPPDADDPPGVSVLLDPDGRTPREALPAHEVPVATTLPNLPSFADSRPLAPLALELPPEPGGSPQELRQPRARQEDAAVIKAARSGGAGRAIVIVLIIVAVALAAVLVYRLFGKQLLGNAGAEEAQRVTEQALATLRRDDLGAQVEALTRLQQVQGQHPALLEPQAAMVLVSALRFDDTNGKLVRARDALRTLKANDGPGERIATLEASITNLETSAASLKQELTEGLTRLQANMQKLEPGSPEHLAGLRAEGMARGVLGDGEALTRAEAYRQRAGGDADDWVDLIEPEYALNGGSSLDEAIVQLREVKGRGGNSTFLRPAVLLARLQLKRGEAALAREELERVVTLNSKHEIARDLLASLPKQ